MKNSGIPIDDVVAALAAKRARDVPWAEGRAFGMVYDGGDAVHEVAERVAAMYLHENALNTVAFPSLGEIQREVVRWTADLLAGPDSASGFLTSGGTESILCAVKAAREHARHERGIVQPEMVLADSAHAAFHKAAHLFGVTPVVVPVGEDWRADTDAMIAAIEPNTALVVTSAVSYPQGVIDDIASIATAAADRGVLCHVDACMGGFFLPFMERLGHDVDPWNFAVEGVTSISADVHKLGYAPKGASVICYRDKALRAHQTFVFDDWLGGFYASPNLQGSRAGLPMAMAWGVMAHLGVDGYVERTAAVLGVTDRMRAEVRATPGLVVLGDPTAHIFCIAADAEHAAPIDPFALGDAMAARGWFHDRQTPPDSLHLTLSFGNVDQVDAWIEDLREVAPSIGNHQVDDRSTNYATLE